MLLFRISYSVGAVGKLTTYKLISTVSPIIKDGKTRGTMLERVELNGNVYTSTSASVRCASTLKFDDSEKTLPTEIKTYEETIKALNSLQSNADSIRNSIVVNNKQAPLSDTIKYLNKSGLNLEDIEKLSVIHVSGTKGKGSTCASTESILRAHGVKTGFYSSPHLISVNERIRINGLPMEKEKFTQSFWKVYHSLHQKREHPLDMPSYFKFLTLLCFHVFLEENVDVAIIEVGIGGKFDCTNIIRNAQIVGITSLGLEHTQLLGETLLEIAEQKAGIIKPKSKVFTAVTQKECLDLIKETANINEATFVKVPDISKYFHGEQLPDTVENLNNVTKLNGSLAIQLANAWLQQHHGTNKDYIFDGEIINEKFLKGLTDCNWPGRCQIEKINEFNIHLDGAHTVESITICTDWFTNAIKKSKNKRVLLFNTTGDRDSNLLLEILSKNNNFDIGIFVPNVAVGCSNKNDNAYIFNSNLEQIKRAKRHAAHWRSLNNDVVTSAYVFNNILDSLEFLKQHFGNEELNILVTGSLHLIGCTILALEEFTSISDTLKEPN